MKTKKTKEIKVKFYSDSGHGWGAVKRQTLLELGILDKISRYSYQRGKTVYLEEDRDVSIFIAACKDCGIVVVPDYSTAWHNRSPIRSYDGFEPTKVM